MAFYTILTDIGKAKLANATALGTAVSLKDIAVGDGGGVAVQPATTDTALTNEVWRAALNNISIDSSNENWVVAEGYIPSTDGDFTVREVGLFDVDGDMIAVGNYPDTYKPTLASGSAKDLYIKVIIEVSDAGVVELKIDPAVVLSTRKYVDDEVAKRALLQGDNTLTFKVAAAVNPDEAIAFGQFTGYVLPFATSTVPNGFLECNGAELSRTTYANLYAVIGDTYGAGDGSTTFNIPDLRGEFIRGFDNGRGVDSGRAIGTAQIDEFKSHNHNGYERTISIASNSNYRFSSPSDTSNPSPTVNSNTVQNSGGSETRPRNIAMMYCIKY